MISYEQVNEFITENFQNVTIQGNHYHTRCPFCGDSKVSQIKKRFHLSLKDGGGVFHCFNCNIKGDFYTLYSLINNISRKQAWDKFNSFNSGDIKQRLKKRVTSSVIKSSNCNWILKDCFGLDHTPSGYVDSKYIAILKQFKKDRLVNTPIFICYQGKYKDRIILPIYDKEDIVYFQSRTIFPSHPTKYLNPPVNKSQIIYNKDNLTNTKTVYVTEGLLDAQSMDNGTCCFGKEISDDWLKLLMDTVNTQNICIVLDNDDSGKESLKTILQNSKYKKLLRYFVMPDDMSNIKDINNLKVVYPDLDINLFVDQNSYSQWKIVTKGLV
jgi:hypothetical protein